MESWHASFSKIWGNMKSVKNDTSIDPNKLNGTSFSYLTPWDPAKSTLRPATLVVSCFIQCEDKFLLLQRAKKDEQHCLWGIPGGKLRENESPLEGLQREILEETGLSLSSETFLILGTAMSCTPCDGEYGLYVYHAFVSDSPKVSINQSEHYAFQWLTLKQFLEFPLLTAQREAYQLVEEKLKLVLRKKTNFPE